MSLGSGASKESLFPVTGWLSDNWDAWRACLLMISDAPPYNVSPTMG